MLPLQQDGDTRSLIAESFFETEISRTQKNASKLVDPAALRRQNDNINVQSEKGSDLEVREFDHECSMTMTAVTCLPCCPRVRSRPHVLK